MVRGAKNFPDASARRSRDLPTNDKNRSRARKRFSKRAPRDLGDQSPPPARRKIDAHYSINHPHSSVDRQLASARIRARWLGLLSRWRIAGGHHLSISALARLSAAD